MPSTKYIIELTETDRKCLTDIVKKGNSAARTILKANILLASDRGNKKHMTVAEISTAFKATPHKAHLTALYAICLQLFRHILQKASLIHKVAAAFFVSSDKESDVVYARRVHLAHSLCAVLPYISFQQIQIFSYIVQDNNPEAAPKSQGIPGYCWRCPLHL